MKRNEQKITKEETIVTFIASDGEVFENEEDCAAYEKSYVCTIKTCFKKIPHLEKAASSLYMQYGNEEDEAYMLIPRNIEDVYAVNRILDYCDGLYGSTYLTPPRLTQDDIDKTVLINFGNEGMESEYLKQISDELNKCETEIKNEIVTQK